MKLIEVVSFLLACQTSAVLAQRELAKPRPDDLAITLSQKKALDEFTDRVKSIVPHDYMKEPVFLIRWLRARGYNVKAAQEFLIKNLEWRNSSNIDNILEEDFSDMEHDFPVFVDTYDKKGQPAITASAGQWDLRQSHLTGRDKRMFRYIIRVLEKASLLVRKEQQKGKNVTRFHYILNLDQFNAIQHACPRCLITIFDVFRSYDLYYPEIIDKIVFVNAPPSIRVLLGPVLTSAVSDRTIGSVDFKMIGTNKKEWQQYLFGFIDEDQLTEEFGGSRVRSQH